MDIFSKEIIIPITAAILGIAVPLLIGVIQRIDDKYESTRLIQLFMNERSTKHFLGLLAITIFLLFYQLVAPPNYFDFGVLTKYIDYSAIILATIFCVLLTFSIFMIFRLIYIYNVPEKLQKHLIKRNNIPQDIRKAWFELFIAMLKQNNVDVLRDCYQELYDWTISLREGRQWTVMEYPPELYEGIISVNEQLCMQQKKAVSIKNGNDIVNVMLDGVQFTIMHQNTYRTIWTCLNQQLFYKHSEWIIKYWNAANSLLLLHLADFQLNERIYVSYTSSGQVIADSKMVKLRQKERKEFKEFHIALGGLLLFKKEHKLLNQLLYYTNSQPPHYVLIPDSLAEIILLYMDLLSSDSDSMYRYEQKYPFLGLQAGVRNNSIINGWIQKYLYILMLRLATLNRTYVYEDFYSLPALPESLSEKNEWLENVPIILKQIEQNSIPLEDITTILPLDQSCIYRAKHKLKNALESLSNSLTSAIQHQKVTQQLSEDEIQDFYQIASDSIGREMKWITEVSVITDDEHKSCNKFDCVGRIRQLMPAEAFCTDKTIGYVNFKESFSAATLYSFKNCWLRSFQYQPKSEYRVFPENLDKAFQTLRLTDKQIIIGFHFNWYNAYPQNLRKENEYKFKSPDNRLLYSLSGDHTVEFTNTVIILNKSDLPKLKLLDPPSTLKDKFHLKCINEQYKLYASVIKLSENKPLLNEYISSGAYLEKELKQMALVCTELDAQILWKQNIPVVMIKVLDRFIDSGNENLSEIRPFNAD